MLLALDIATHVTGYCIGSSETQIVEKGSLVHPKGLKPYERIHSNLTQIKTLISAHNIHTIAIEGAAHGIKSSSMNILAEQQGVIKYNLIQQGLGVSEIPITKWKKKLTGRGNAKKAEILERVKELGFDVATQDEADAIGIYLYAIAQPALVTIQ